MVKIGRSFRWFNDYQEEVDFCLKHGFDFMQIWFKDGKILMNNVQEPKENYIKDVGFPVIIHAVFDPIDFENYGDRLLEIVEFLGSNEVIVHPVCEKSPVNENTEEELAQQVKIFSQKAKSKGIVWYLENNSVLNGFHCKDYELSIVYNNDEYVEQLLDVAHIYSYEHLEEIIAVKFPKCLHIAGKHFNIVHEHLPLTCGDIDYKLVFQKYLKNFSGRMILEIVGTDEEIIASKKVIDEAYPKC